MSEGQHKRQRLNSRFVSDQESLGLALWRLSNIWQARQRRALIPFGLTHVQFALLASLVWLEEDTPVTQQQLASFAHVDPMMTSQVVRILEKKGLLLRRRHPKDARARALIATPEGVELANRANVAIEAEDASFFAPLTPANRAVLSRVLSQLIERAKGTNTQSET